MLPGCLGIYRFALNDFVDGVSMVLRSPRVQFSVAHGILGRLNSLADLLSDTGAAHSEAQDEISSQSVFAAAVAAQGGSNVSHDGGDTEMSDGVLQPPSSVEQELDADIDPLALPVAPSQQIKEVSMVDTSRDQDLIFLCGLWRLSLKPAKRLPDFARANPETMRDFFPMLVDQLVLGNLIYQTEKWDLESEFDEVNGECFPLG